MIDFVIRHTTLNIYLEKRRSYNFLQNLFRRNLHEMVKV